MSAAKQCLRKAADHIDLADLELELGVIPIPCQKHRNVIHNGTRTLESTNHRTLYIIHNVSSGLCL